MKPIQDKTFSIHDTTIGIWRAHLGDAAVKVDWMREHDWETHEAVRMMLVRDGFTFHQDPDTKKCFRRLAKYHHSGGKQDVCFHSGLSGRHHEIVFFEDVVRDNQNGGRYHFDKLKKMPYQRRKKTELALRKVAALLVSLGFVDTTKRRPELAIDRCMQEREELGLFQGERFYAQAPAEYNSRDVDGNLLRDGQIRYFWDYRGRLGRGVVFHHINNMWWVISSPYTLLNIASHAFFDWQLGMPLKKPADRRKKIEAALSLAVRRSDFERAVVLRDLLGIQVGEPLKEAA